MPQLLGCTLTMRLVLLVVFGAPLGPAGLVLISEWGYLGSRPRAGDHGRMRAIG